MSNFGDGGKIHLNKVYFPPSQNNPLKKGMKKMDLEKDVKYIKGVGPNRVKLLNKLNIFILKDVITYYPRAYEDRSKPKSLCECMDGEEVVIEAVACGKM